MLKLYLHRLDSGLRPNFRIDKSCRLMEQRQTPPAEAGGVAWVVLDLTVPATDAVGKF